MKTESYNLKFITPCFCAGADQSVAEIRAPSIRGKLRWWFRVIGGNSEQEAEVFGSVASDFGNASALGVRVRSEGITEKWCQIEFSGMSNTGYVLYFAKAAAEGARWVPTGAIPVGTTFELQLIWRRTVSAPAQEFFDRALESFLLLGSLGLRSSRGLGCFECLEHPFKTQDWPDLMDRVRERADGFLGEIGEFSGGENEILEGLGAQLRGLRQGGFSAGPPGSSNPTPLGSSSRPRQSSAVYLRPVRVEEGKYRIVVFEAPGDKVLGPQSRRKAPRLRNGLPMPLPAPSGRRR